MLLTPSPCHKLSHFAGTSLERGAGYLWTAPKVCLERDKLVKSYSANLHLVSPTHSLINRQRSAEAFITARIFLLRSKQANNVAGK